MGPVYVAVESTSESELDSPAGAARAHREEDEDETASVASSIDELEGIFIVEAVLETVEVGKSYA